MHITRATGKLDGLSTYWHQSGWKQSERNFKDDKQHGITIFYNREGNETLREHWQVGELILKSMPTETLRPSLLGFPLLRNGNISAK